MIGCTSSTNSEQKYKAWFADQDNGYYKTRQIGSLKYIVQQRPASYMAINELRSVKDQSQYDSILNSYSGNWYFIMDISFENKAGDQGQPVKGVISSYEDYKKMISDLSFNIGTNVTLEVGVEELAPSLAHFESGFELSNSNRFVFSFPKEEEKEVRFVFRDQYFGTGIQKFKFSNQKVQPDLPKFD